MAILDLHVDMLIQHTLFGYRPARKHRAGLRGQPLVWHADVPRMREAGYGGACLGIHWWPRESGRAWRGAGRQLDAFDRLVDADAGIGRVEDPGDWRRGGSDGELVLAPGVEGAHMLGGELERVEELADRGVAYLTLTHFSKNSAATPSMGWRSNEQDGLTDFGRELVVELERHGVVVDLAHVNTPGVLEACRVAERPVLCTHTGVKGVHDNARNISDAEIDAIAETGGVIGIIFAPSFLAGRLVADSRVVVDHIEYVAERVGVEHVAIGSDYDGWIPTIPSDQRDCRDIVRIPEILAERGWGEEAIAKVMGENARATLSGARAGSRE